MELRSALRLTPLCWIPPPVASTSGGGLFQRDDISSKRLLLSSVFFCEITFDWWSANMV